MSKNNFTIMIVESLQINSDEYFSKALIKSTGFREYDVRWLIEKELNYTGIVVLGSAFGTLLQNDYGISEVIVGNDFRSYSQNVKHSLIVGLMHSGMRVIDIGLCVTPCVYFAQYYLGIPGAAMVTASHNENGWTGIKLGYGLSKTLGPDGISRFKDIVYQGKYRTGKGTYEQNDTVAEAYIKDLIKYSSAKRKLRIVIATGNGTAGLFTPEVLRQAGHDIIEQNIQLDWNFPHFNPNPEDIAFLRDIGNRTKETGADVGIGIDGDGDRIGVVDEKGEEIFSDKVGLMLARSIASEHPGRTFIVDVKSTGLFKVDEILTKHKCPTIYWKTGHSYLKAKVQESNAIAGFEKSGHFFFNEPYGRGYDDGSLSAVHFCNFLSQQDEPLSHILESLPKSYQTPTMAPFCDDHEKYAVVEQITQMYQKDLQGKLTIAGVPIEELITVNGVRVQYADKSWGLVRASSNKPSLVVVAESFTTRKRVYDIIGDITQKLNATGKVGAWDQTLPPYTGE